MQLSPDWSRESVSVIETTATNQPVTISVIETIATNQPATIYPNFFDRRPDDGAPQQVWAQLLPRSKEGQHRISQRVRKVYCTTRHSPHGPREAIDIRMVACCWPGCPTDRNFTGVRIGSW